MLVANTDEAQVAAAESLLAMAASQKWIHADWARSRNFVVVALPGQELSAIDDDALARAIRHLGVTELLAVKAPWRGPPGPPDPEVEWVLEQSLRDGAIIVPPTVYLLSPTAEDIRALYCDHPLHHEVLTDRQLLFLVFLTLDETSLIAGPRQFVEATLGKTIEAAWKEFEAYAEDWAKQGWLGGHLISDYKWLADLA